MVYFFLGVPIVADIFMNSIEAVTSWKRKVMDRDKGKTVTVNLWNDTVATLTLMALGSSAPEIFLSVVETFKREFHAGDLGPSTIVGSAAFNLFSIISVCVLVIPRREIRRIVNMNAFWVTAIFSVFAYLWMGFVLVIHGPNVVDPLEACLTLLWLPILVWVSYSVDVGWLSQIISQYSGDSAEPTREEASSHFIGFESDELVVMGSRTPQELNIQVLRKGGLRNPVFCTYRTQRLTAVPGYDFEESSGTVEFPEGSTSQSIKIEVLPKRVSAVGRSFLVILESTDEVCDFHPESDGPEEQCFLTVKVEPSSAEGSVLRSFDAVTNTNHFAFALEDWKEQFVSACYCNGSQEEQKEATRQDWFFHIVALPWKLLFAAVPSPVFFGGWLAFFVAIGLIGALTAVISDLAEMFGCLLDVPDIVTALTFVALGTSMPDLFASISAAVDDPTADASIVNVTGSNSVNVFLGLGVPWTVASFYWSSAERDADWEMRYPEVAKESKYDGSAVFVVESRDLGFCVMVFSGLCIIAILLLVMRRKYLGAELGGPTVPKVASSILLAWLWLAFVALSSWRVLRCENATLDDWCKASVTEQVLVCGGVLLVTFFVSLPTLISTRWYLETAKREAIELKKENSREDFKLHAGSSLPSINEVAVVKFSSEKKTLVSVVHSIIWLNRLMRLSSEKKDSENMSEASQASSGLSRWSGVARGRQERAIAKEFAPQESRVEAKKRACVLASGLNMHTRTLDYKTGQSFAM
jgi:Ca2+/Na+ antiporter